MNAKQKIILACVAGLLCIGVAWYLFSVPSTDPTDSSRVEKRLDDTAREQQKAADSIEAVSRGLEDSTDRVADIDAGLGQNLKQALTASQSETALLLNDLTRQRQETKTLRDQLQTLQQQSTVAGNSLAEAQKYLDDTRTEFLKNEKAHEKTERRLKNRIEAWQVVAAILCGVALAR